MNIVGGAKELFYHYFKSKEEVMHALGNQLFFENNPFETVKAQKELNGLEKIKSLLLLYSGDTERNKLNVQAISILKDPHILAVAIEEKRRILTPLWFVIIFWLIPSVFPATMEELQHKYRFVMEVLSHMGLPLMDEKIIAYTEKFAADISVDEKKK